MSTHVRKWGVFQRRGARRSPPLTFLGLLACVALAACGAVTQQSPRQRLVTSLDSLMGEPGLRVQAVMPLTGPQLISVGHALGLHLSSVVPRLSGVRLAVETTVRNHAPSDAPPPASQYGASEASVYLHATPLYRSTAIQGEEYIQVNWSRVAQLGGHQGVQAFERTRRTVAANQGGLRRFLAGGLVSVPLTAVLSQSVSGSPNYQFDFLSQLATTLQTSTVFADPNDPQKYIVIAPVRILATDFLTAFKQLVPQATPVLARIKTGLLPSNVDAHLDIYTSKSGTIEYLTVDPTQFLSHSRTSRPGSLPLLFSMHLEPANPTISPNAGAAPVAYDKVEPLLGGSGGKQRLRKGRPRKR